MYAFRNGSVSSRRCWTARTTSTGETSPLAIFGPSSRAVSSFNAATSATPVQDGGADRVEHGGRARVLDVEAVEHRQGRPVRFDVRNDRRRLVERNVNIDNLAQVRLDEAGRQRITFHERHSRRR